VNPYQVYGLKDNPFPPQPIEAIGSKKELFEYARKVCEPVRRKEIDEIKSKFFRVFLSRNPKATNLWILGDIGVGKTAILVHAWQLLEEKYKQILPIFIQCPQTGIYGIYDMTLSYLDRGFFEDLSTALVGKVIQSHPELLEDKEAKSIAKKLAQPDKRKKEVLRLIDDSMIDIDAVARVGTMDFSNGRLFVEDRLLNWVLLFCSDQATYYEKLTGYPRNGRLNGLATLFYLIHLMGYEMTVLIMDQLEYFWDTLTFHRRRALALDVRELVQRSLPYMSFATTTNVTTSDDMRYNHPTIYRALPWNDMKVVKISRLSSQAARTLVVWYLNLERRKSTSCHPFTEKAIDVAYDLAGKNVGELLVGLHGILNKAVDQRKPPKNIDENFIRKHMKIPHVAPEEALEEGIEIKPEEIGR